MKPLKLFIFSFCLIIGGQALAAACCGGGFSVPSLITGDDEAMLTTSFAYSKVDTDVSQSGVWKKNADDQISQTFKIEAAHIFSDRFQVGGSLPIVQRNRGSQDSSSGFGDTALMLGYEYLPDWDYNLYRPKGIGFLQLTMPTGKSIYDAENQDQLDARGRGFWALGVGTSLTKSIRAWDFHTLFEFHRAFQKATDSAQAQGQIMVKPGWGGSLETGAGWNKGDLRVGTSLAWNYEDAIDVTGAIASKGAPQRYATGTLMTSYMWTQEWALAASYSDQTLFGSPSNTTLAKSVVVSLQRRWAR
jgi:hypothetical protein